MTTKSKEMAKDIGALAKTLMKHHIHKQARKQEKRLSELKALMDKRYLSPQEIKKIAEQKAGPHTDWLTKRERKVYVNGFMDAMHLMQRRNGAK